MVRKTPPARFEPTPKRIRAVCDGKTIVDTTNAILVWEHEYYPRYYFPIGELAEQCHDTSGAGAIEGYVALKWDEMDSWFEENEEVFVHPRDPYTRIDALPSNRSVRVEIDGETVAESTNPVILFETGLPERYYLPAADVRQDLLTPSDTTSACPYKGVANYFSVGDHADIVWTYPSPLRESSPVEGLLAFYNEKVDLIVDGQRCERPSTKFSQPGIRLS